MAEIPILLLAAGESRRMGKAKQLLPWGSTTLIEHQVQTLLITGKPLAVVVGHLAERMLPLLQKYPVLILVHKHWVKGIGSSISFGIRELEMKFPHAEGALICQVDQPLITASHYNHLISAFQAYTPQIIVSRSPFGWEGVPVLFGRTYFKELQLLKGDEGARKIFRKHSQSVRFIESCDILEDMDVPEVYDQLLAKYKP